jgi:hypothetical protein
VITNITLYAVFACFVALGQGNLWLIAGLHADPPSLLSPSWCRSSTTGERKLNDGPPVSTSPSPRDHNRPYAAAYAPVRRSSCPPGQELRRQTRVRPLRTE